MQVTSTFSDFAAAKM